MSARRPQPPGSFDDTYTVILAMQLVQARRELAEIEGYTLEQMQLAITSGAGTEDHEDFYRHLSQRNAMAAAGASYERRRRAALRSAAMGLALVDALDAQEREYQKKLQLRVKP